MESGLNTTLALPILHFSTFQTQESKNPQAAVLGGLTAL